MSATRRSDRLQKRPRLSYVELTEDDMLIEEDEDEEFNPDRRKQPERKPKKDDAAAAKRNIFRWADLPAELRNSVYQAALTQDGPLELYLTRVHSIHRVVKRYQKADLVPNLVLLNKSTYTEAAPILYQNELHFEATKTLYHFLCRLSPITKSWIADITLFGMHMTSAYKFPAFQSMIGTVNLTRFKFDDCDADARFIVNHAYDWLITMAEQKGVEAALNVLYISDYVGKRKRELPDINGIDMDGSLVGIQTDDSAKAEAERGNKMFREILEIRLAERYRHEAETKKARPAALQRLLEM